MKIVRRNRDARVLVGPSRLWCVRNLWIKGDGALSEDIDRAKRTLHSPQNGDERAIAQGIAVALVYIRSNDDVHQTVLILQGNEDVALGGLRPLPDYDEPAHANVATIGPTFELPARNHTQCRKASPIARDQVSIQAESQDEVVQQHLVVFGTNRERGCLLR